MKEIGIKTHISQLQFALTELQHTIRTMPRSEQPIAEREIARYKQRILLYGKLLVDAEDAKKQS